MKKYSILINIDEIYAEDENELAEFIAKAFVKADIRGSMEVLVAER